MNDVRISIPGHNPLYTEISIDGHPITRAMSFVLSVDLDTIPTLTLVLVPDSIEYVSEAEIICRYSDPVTGETFTRTTGMSE